MPAFRLRQLVIATDTPDAIDELMHLLQLEPPFVDPEVATFGLTNGVFALGDQFLEIVIPVSDAAPAKRFLKRGGPGGYMAIFQTDDLETVRARCDTLGIRRVVDIDRENISATHLHPADTGAAIMSIDEADPADGWPWGGPDWKHRSAIARICGADLTSPTPMELANKWAEILGLPVALENGIPHIWLDDGPVRALKGDRDRLTAFHIRIAEPDVALARAEELGLTVTNRTILFHGTDLILQE